MKKRLVIAFSAMLMAIVLGLAAPEPSSAAIYRSMLIGFAFLFIASRIISLGALFGETIELVRPASKARMPKISSPTPIFVTDPRFGIAPEY